MSSDPFKKVGTVSMTQTKEISAYNAFLSPDFQDFLLERAEPVTGVSDLLQLGSMSGLESPASLTFACELYDALKESLCRILDQRAEDRHFIDQRTRECVAENELLKTDFQAPEYKTIIGEKDPSGRVVAGPLSADYFQAAGEPVAEIPDWLAPPHVTLFGPPSSAKMAINAMNAYHRTLPEEPQVIAELLERCDSVPKWGADDEDSKTPLRQDLVTGSMNLAECFRGTIGGAGEDEKYQLAKSHLSLPIKRIPGIALPSSFLFYRGNPLPLHVYDFALHLFDLWDQAEALVFYIPKLETEEEAAYIAEMIRCAEQKIKALHPEYELGTVRVLIVLETPRALFRANEIMDALHPYFAGASLGWHDFLASTARLFKEDNNYRIPVKSDPEIVVKHIKASHDLLARVVGPRGGIKIGGMYGVLPTNMERDSGSFQVSIKGFIRDVIIQLRRNLNGFWVAHPDFVRIGLALVQAWQEHREGSPEPLERLLSGLLQADHLAQVKAFIENPDVDSLDASDPLFPRGLLAAELRETGVLANNDEEEVRYNVFQSLQYMTDWLNGNGCVALPATIENEQIRVMDDLATTERSRWEVWHEIYHGRFDAIRLTQIALEEIAFIRNPPAGSERQIQVVWNAATARWYPIALRVMLLLMTSRQPVEFASELLLPFTVEEIRQAEDPYQAMVELEPHKYQLGEEIEALLPKFQ